MRTVLAACLLLLVSSHASAATGLDARLKSNILAACPAVTSVTVEPGAMSVSTLPSSQDACVRAAMDAFKRNDVAAQTAFDNLQGRTDASTTIASATSADAKLLRALAAVLLDELNTLRALHGLPPRTLTQAITAIQNKLNAGTVD